METNTQEQICFVTNIDTKKSYIKVGEKVFHTDVTPTFINIQYFKFIKKINPSLTHRIRFYVYLFNEILDVIVIVDKENFFRIYESGYMNKIFELGKWSKFNLLNEENVTWLDKDLTCLEVEKLFSIKLINE